MSLGAGVTVSESSFGDNANSFVLPGLCAAQRHDRLYGRRSRASTSPPSSTSRNIPAWSIIRPRPTATRSRPGRRAPSSVRCGWSSDQGPEVCWRQKIFRPSSFFGPSFVLGRGGFEGRARPRTRRPGKRGGRDADIAISVPRRPPVVSSPFRGRRSPAARRSLSPSLSRSWTRARRSAAARRSPISGPAISPPSSMRPASMSMASS